MSKLFYLTDEAVKRDENARRMNSRTTSDATLEPTKARVTVRIQNWILSVRPPI